MQGLSSGSLVYRPKRRFTRNTQSSIPDQIRSCLGVLSLLRHPINVFLVWYSIVRCSLFSFSVFVFIPLFFSTVDAHLSIVFSSGGTDFAERRAAGDLHRPPRSDRALPFVASHPSTSRYAMFYTSLLCLFRRHWSLHPEPVNLWRVCSIVSHYNHIAKPNFSVNS